MKLVTTFAALSAILGQIAIVTEEPGPVPNPFLSANTYAVTHFDPAQTDTTPYPALRGTFQVELRQSQRIPGGPVGYMQLASTSQYFMWITATGAVHYADILDGNLKSVGHVDTPGMKPIAPETLDSFLNQRFTSVEQIEKGLKELGINWSRIANNIYMLVDKDNFLYANAGKDKVHVYGLIDPKDPTGGIKVHRTLDFSKTLQQVSKQSDNPSQQPYGVMIVALNLTYDGKLIVVTNRSLTVLDRSFEGPQHTIEFGPDEYVSNSIAVDENNGIYVASDKKMHKLVWTGLKLSQEEVDGAWSSPYDFGSEPPSIKFGSGTGSTPSLMGFGSDPDKLVVITDGSDQMKLVAFWRNEIPKDFQQKAGTKSRRIADQIAVTGGLSPLPQYIQSKQSVVVKNYGAFVVNNIRPKGHKDKLIDVLAGGPVFDPPTGMERFEWDPKAHQWKSIWTRNDVVSTSMIPSASAASNMVFVNGYTRKDGWEVTGMDWLTGETVHRTIFGQDNLGNGAYALIQFLPTGDLLFNSIGGATLVELTKMKHRSDSKTQEVK